MKIIDLITFDAISPLALPCYGNRVHYLPELSRLLQQGLIFHEHYSRAAAVSATHRVTLPELTTRADFPEFLRHSEEWPGVTLLQKRCDLSDPDQVADIIETLNRSPRTKAESPGGQIRWWDLRVDQQGRLSDSLHHFDEILGQIWPQDGTAAQSEEDRLLVVTAVCGRLPEQSHTAESPGFESALDQSLTARLWVPLLIIPQSTRHEHPIHRLMLTCEADLWTTMLQWLGVSPELSTVFPGLDLLAETPAASRRLVLQDDGSYGLLTETELLQVPRSCLENLDDLSAAVSTAKPEVPAAGRIFRKPDDRFELNDLATTIPEVLQDRWQTLWTLRD